MFRYLILIISYVFISVIILANPFNFSIEITSAIFPWATLTLVFITVITILRLTIKEERAVRLRRLGHIEDWATDIVGKTRTVEVPELKTIDTGGADTYERLRQIDEINDFKRLHTQSPPIKNIARMVDKELYATVSHLVQAIDDLLKEDWQNMDLNATRDWLTEHESRIYDTAITLINDISKRLEKY